MKTFVSRTSAVAILAVLLLSYPATIRAQFNIPPVSDAHCASCGANMTRGEAHSSNCEYYSAPEEEESTPTPAPTPKPTPPPAPTPKPTVTPRTTPPWWLAPTPRPQQTQTQSTHLRDYTPMTEEERQYQRAWNGHWEQTFTDENGHTNRVVALNEGQGIYNFTAKKWMLEPRYQRIIVPGYQSAVVQLMKNGTWRLKDLRVDADETEYFEGEEVEFDEIKYLDDNHQWVALNKKDEYGRDHWRIWLDGNWKDAWDYSYQKLDIFANKRSGKYDLVCQYQDGEWELALEGSGSLGHLSSVKRINDYGLYMIGVKKDEWGKEVFNLVHNDGLGLLPTNMDRITPDFGPFYKIELEGRKGIIEVVDEVGNVHADMLVPPEYNYAKLENVPIPDLGYSNSRYAIVGDGRGYAMYSLRYHIQMLPPLFTTDEVSDFEKRLICAANTKYASVREKYDKTFSSEGKSDFRTYCQGIARDCYRGLTVNTMTEDEARETLKEDNLRNGYFQCQNSLYNKKSKLGSYDKNAQAFTIKTHWGTISLPVPPEEAEAVKNAWKRRKTENIVEYGFDLGRDYRPILSDITIKVNGKEYTSR